MALWGVGRESSLPLVQISFSPQPSTGIQIKDGDHNLLKENTEHSLAKITRPLQANFSFVQKTDLAFLIFILMEIMRCFTSY